MKELTNKVVEFTKERDWDQFHSPENLAKSICIEAGELLECFQWNNEFDLEEVKEELADVIIMICQFIHKNKISHQNLLDEISKKLIRYYETISDK